ncbi:MAG TPA: G1 family glutamic endopeptidase [Streptosporangiaceae bacterium]
MIAMAAAVPVIGIGFHLAQRPASHLATSADVQSVPGGQADQGGQAGMRGWGRGGFPMMPGAASSGPVLGPVNAAAASANWAGYAAAGQPGSFTSVSASWSQPAVNCGNAAQTFSAFWVGLDGDGTPTVEQTGTEADCANGAAANQGWYEIFPNPPVFYNNPVQPADAMTASVTSNGNGMFTLTLTDTTEGWTQSTQQSEPNAQLGSAEVIAEAPSNGQQVLPLANFGSVNFSNTTVDNQPLGNEGQNLTAITMQAGNTSLATPSALNGGNAFSVTWDSSGAAASNGQGGGQGGQGVGGQGGQGVGGQGTGGQGNGQSWIRGNPGQGDDWWNQGY